MQNKSIERYKELAKKLFKDYKTLWYDEEDIYRFSPQYVKNIDDIFLSFDIDVNGFSLMKAQHIVALLAGFKKWSDIYRANEMRLDMGIYLVERAFKDEILFDDWDMTEHSLRETLMNQGLDSDNIDSLVYSYFDYYFNR